MGSLPTGTVTFVFTDIEGSTSMLQRLGDEAFLSVLEDHNRLIRDAFGQGVEIRSEGDAFFYVFASAADALAAAGRAQDSLAGHLWPEGGTVRVRMGMHTGTGKLGGDDYVGLDVHRAARIAAAGHGGQVLLSRATREAGPADDAMLRDLGEHRFKDLGDSEHVFQLLMPGLAADHPPIRSLDARPNNLPAQPSEFIGRSEETAEVADLLHRARLVTLTGPGGAGKTRIAIKVASAVLSRFDHGVTFVPLEALRDPALVSTAIATALGLEKDAALSPVETAANYLADKDTLLLLDNFEHVIAAAPDVAHLLGAAPRLRILATSQAVLRIRGEHAYDVPPLSAGEAMDLFTTRAAAADPNFQLAGVDGAVVAELIRRLESMPLALELAAARVRLFGIRGLLDRVATRLDVGSGPSDLPDRHRTLRAAIEWSYDLLDPTEQGTLRRLGVFDGGFTMDAAEAIAGERAVETVGSLLDKSLLRTTVQRGEARFTMLDSIRRFCLDRLIEAGDHQEASEAHARFYVELAERARPVLERSGQQAWLDRLAAEHDNIRAVLRRSVEQGAPDEGLRTAGAAWRFFHRRGHLPEAREWLERLLAMPGASARARAEGMNGLAGVVYWQGEYTTSLGLYEELLDLFAALDEPERVADTLFALSTTSFFLDDLEAGAAYGAAARTAYEAAGAEHGLRRAVAAEAFYMWRAGRLPEALELWKRTHDMYVAAGDIGEVMQTQTAIATITHQLGRTDEALELGRSTLDGMVDAGDPSGTIMVLDFLGVILARRSPLEAMTLAGAASRLGEELGGGLRPHAVALPPVPEIVDGLRPEAELESAWGTGEAMDLDQAVAYARRLTGG